MSTLRRPGRRLPLVWTLVLGILALGAAAAATLLVLHRTTKSPSAARSTTSATTPAAPAPASLRLPGGLPARAEAVGVSADGWLAQDAALSLQGGSAGLLELVGSVPVGNQKLTVAVAGRALASQAIAAGPFDLKLLLPAHEGNRRVDLHFAHTTKLGAPDNRTAAARLKSIAVSKIEDAPRAVQIPVDLTRRNVIANGIAGDGWTGAHATLALAAGPAATLAVRGEVPQPAGGARQRLRIAVNGATVADQDVQPGAVNVRVPLGPSDTARAVDLRWSTVSPLSKQDPRRLAARLTSVSLAPLHGVTQLRPQGLAKSNATYSGIYADGWAQKDARIVLAGGPTAKLVIDAVTPTKGQYVTVLADDRALVRTELAGGRNTVEVPLEPSNSPRVLELRFARTAPIAANDPRQAAALLQRVAVERVPRSAPAVVHMPQDLGRSPLVYSGIYRDGWTQQDARMVIAGGGPTTLTVKADTRLKRQRMTVFVDGARLGAAKLPAGKDVVRVAVRASPNPRLVELTFARSAAIAPGDPRVASTRLRLVALANAAPAVAPPPSLHADLRTSAVVPPLQGSARGSFTGVLSKTTLKWRLATRGLSGPIIAAVIHTGADGQVGPTLVDLCRPCQATASGELALSAAGAAALRAGQTYVNVGTSANPYGEIRGRIRNG